MIKTMPKIMLALVACLACGCASTNISSDFEVPGRTTTEVVTRSSTTTIENLGPGTVVLEARRDGLPAGEPRRLVRGRTWRAEGPALRVLVDNDSDTGTTLRVRLRGGESGTTSLVVLEKEGGRSEVLIDSGGTAPDGN